MSSGINQYKTDLRDMRFLLFELLNLEELLGDGPYKEWGRKRHQHDFGRGLQMVMRK